MAHLGPILCCVFLLSPLWAIPLHILAAFPQELLPHMSRALRKAVSDVDSRLAEKEMAVVATPVSIPNNSHEAISILCDHLRLHNPSILLSFLDRPRGFFASLVGGYTGIPVFAASQGYNDEAAKEVNSFYLGLNPSPADLAGALFQFLCSNEWFHASMIRDDTQFSSSLFGQLTSLARHPPWGKIQQLEVGRSQSEEQIFSSISTLHSFHSRVIMLHCDTSTATKVLRQAKRANLLNGDRIWIVVEDAFTLDGRFLAQYPPGLLGFRLRSFPVGRQVVRVAVELVAEGLRHLDVVRWKGDFHNFSSSGMSCWFGAGDQRRRFSKLLHSLVSSALERLNTERTTKKLRHDKDFWLSTVFDVFNLLPGGEFGNYWKPIGNVSGSFVSMETVLWLAKNRIGPVSLGRQRFRVVTGFAPPFVMPTTRVENGTCMIGIPCLRVNTSDKEELVRIFVDYARGAGGAYDVSCCAGIAIDLLQTVARDLVFDFDLYLVGDGLFGNNRGRVWNGITADLVSGAAHLTFSAFSMTSARSEVVDFSVPYYHSGVSCLIHSQERDVPLSAFLVPFSVQLWLAIFASLHVTAVFAAIYEWFSPFGLNPWGRQRTKNFSISSALWVMWSLLFSHLVAFKAPKSWPNKVLINLWGCFSVIFVSTYTANIAAHFAGLFFHLRVEDVSANMLLSQKTGTAKYSSAEGYIYSEKATLWQHIKKYGATDINEGIERLRRKDLEILIGDTAVLDYYRGNDPGCSLHFLGESLFEDAYAVGMQKGFPLKEAISQLILKYNSYGYLEQLKRKWYGRTPCFNDSVHRLNKPKPLGIEAVAGVFIMLVVGLMVGIVILFIEHLVFKYALPTLRVRPKECFWKNPNLMFFSQKLYRFINTVELVSPHHSAKEIVTNLREGQIFSLFQKSVKRKMKEEARRRKSKSQFFEMIQEIRKVVKQQNERRIVEPRSAEPKADKQLLLQNKPTGRKGSFQGWRRRRWEQRVADGYQRPLPGYLGPRFLEFDPEAAGSNSSSTVSSVEVNNALSASMDDLRGAGKKGWRRRVRSLDDLSAIKRTLRPLKGERRPPRQLSREIDELKMYSMSKEEIIRLWQASERALLNRLRDTIKEKRALEEKLAFIQKTLGKPP